MRKIIEILNVPIDLMNLGSGIIGGIWLAVIGEWVLIGFGLLLIISSHWLLGLIMMPGLAIVTIGAAFFERKNLLVILGIFFMYLSQFYINLLIIGTFVISFIFCSSFYSGDDFIGYIPYLLWSWGMALGPWQLFTQQDPDNEYSLITTYSASVFYLLFISFFSFSTTITSFILFLFAVVHLIVLPVYNIYSAYQLRE